MNEIIATTSGPIALPAPRVSISIRQATNEDIAFIDGLQKKNAKMVGWMPRATLEGKIRLGHILIAEDDAKERVGYCIGNDRYFKRDDVGIIYQMNVVPGKQRSLIGATLLKAMFDRSAYGCKLFCCWCAQDIAANKFWESLGFVALAFRTGSRTKGAKGQPRVHIFWQRRIREGDTTTPYWFPSQTNSGSIREDRLVLPIPPDTHWSDAKPAILPGMGLNAPESLKRLPGKRERVAKVETPPVPLAIRQASGLHFGLSKPAQPMKEKKIREKTPREKPKNDPRLIAAARELRDRWLEQVNANPLALPSGKYEVSKRPIALHIEPIATIHALPAPIAA